MSVQAYLAGLVPFVTDVVEWPTAQVTLRAFRVDAAVPPDLFGSSRAVVFRNEQVLVLRNLHGVHVLPGGRREGAETPEQTMRREVLEETGWTVGEARQFAAVHLHFSGPPAPEHVGPHPDLLWPLFIALAVHHSADAEAPDGYELSAELTPVADALALPLSRLDEAVLRAALSELVVRPLT